MFAWLAHQIECLLCFLVGDNAQEGSCSSCTESPCRRVPSKTASPVVFVKSASPIVSFSVSACALRRRATSPPRLFRSPPQLRRRTPPSEIAWISQRLSARLRSVRRRSASSPNLAPQPPSERLNLRLSRCKSVRISASILITQLVVFFQSFVDELFNLCRKIGIQPHRRGTGARSRIACAITPRVSPRKGKTPVVISYSTTPNENKSVRASSSSPRTCFGDYLKSYHSPNTFPSPLYFVTSRIARQAMQNSRNYSPAN